MCVKFSLYSGSLRPRDTSTSVLNYSHPISSIKNVPVPSGDIEPGLFKEYIVPRGFLREKILVTQDTHSLYFLHMFVVFLTSLKMH